MVAPGQAVLGALLAAVLLSSRAAAGRSGEQAVSAIRGADQDQRGRAAEWPSEIPRRGWWDILTRVADNISRTNLSLIAAGAAFYGFLAIPSAFAALVSLYGLIFDPVDVELQIQGMRGVLPAETIGLLSQQLQSLTSRPQTALSVSFVTSLVVALWSARSATSSMITALNIAYDEEERRSFVKLQAIAVASTLAGILFALVSLALIAIVPAVIDILPLGAAGKTIAASIRWPLLLAAGMIGLAAMYRFAPCREEPRWRWVSWGAVGAAALWIAGSVLFSIYVGQFGSYDKTYGSLGAVVVLLLWLYLSAFAVLLGAQLNAEMEHQTARDSTTGPPLPMGERGAKMADTLGAARGTTHA